MSLRQRWVGLGFMLSLVVPAIAGAQGSWTVSITPTLNPLPIGFCGAVRLDIVDRTLGDTPRDPTGARVSIADFDMSVTAANRTAVVGQQIDASHWSVCACQAGTAGTVATITASYPAGRVSPKSVVPGVAFQTTATVTLAAAKGRVNPPGCVGATPVTIATVGQPLAAPQPVAPAKTVSPAAAVPMMAGPSPKAGAPLTAAPSGAPAPKLPAAGAPPTGVSVAGPPLSPHVVWTAAPNATRYAVWRSDDGRVSVERSGAGVTVTEFYEGVPDPRITYRYTVVAHYADGTSGAAPAVTFVSPPMVSPSGFVVTPKTMGNVTFDWQPVPGAVRYRLDGPGFPSSGFHTTGTTVTYPKIPAGPGSWKVTTLYYANHADYAGGTVASAVVRVLPPHSKPWLTKNNGPGSPLLVQMPKNTFEGCAPHFPAGELEITYNAAAAGWLGDDLTICRESGGLKLIGLQRWLSMEMPLWGDPAQSGNEAVYGNAVDLGVGRRAQCAQGVMNKPPYHLTTACYATAHGIPPGQTGFNDLNTITHPEEGIGNDFILSMVISKDVTGSTFLVFLRPPGKNTYGRLADKVALDSEGPKYLPHACLSCHGGTYNSTTRKVDGASFLPLDPSLLEFASPADLAAQQENIRKVNEIIYMSDPTTAVGAYIRGLYGSVAALSQPGTQATPDYVPQGWAPQAGFYRSIVKPYCAMCHLAAPVSWNFASWSNFQGNAALIKAVVCSAHTMPHSELQFKAFWTKDTGIVYTPGLLAATIGYPSCP